MKLTITLILALVLVTGTNYSKANTTAQNSSEDRHLSGFKGISLAGSFDYYITQGANESVKVEAPKDVLPNIITEVKGGVLKVYTKSNFKWRNLFSDNKKIIIYITVKDVNSISLAGSGNVFFKGGISVGNLTVNLSGSGDISGKVNVKSLAGSLTGSGDVKLWGTAENLKVVLVGSGDFSARDLVTTNTAVELTGSGDVKVNATGSLNANLSGSGDINYSGNPKSINKSKAGSGDISKD